MEWNQNFLIGISASISLYKTPILIRRLREKMATVRVVMTEHASQLIAPQVFAAIADQPVYMNEFGSNRISAMDHIELKNWTDYFIVYPATANVLGQFANGLAQNLLSTVFIAMPPTKVFLCPAMNSDMYQHPIVQKNINILREIGCHIMEPESGHLACGEYGPGKLLEPELFIEKLSSIK